MATRHPLRRSCAFCRARKIKCSNETICEACRRQGADCIYDFEPGRPRPRSRTVSQDAGRIEPSRTRNTDAPTSHHRRRSCSGAPSKPKPQPPRITIDERTKTFESVTEVLEQRFSENFGHDGVGSRNKSWKDHITTYSQNLQGRQQFTNPKITSKNIRYTDILTLVAQDVVSLVTDRFGSLGCHHIENGGSQFFLSGLANDNTKTMFDEPLSTGDPFATYGQRQQIQLIDVWYSTHPLSFLVSKTLLLREIRDGTHDEILLAIMFADASFSVGDKNNTDKGHALLQWANSQLRTRPLRPGQISATGSGLSTGISTRIFEGISTAQSLILLAWNCICTSQMRRAICYVGLAGRMVSDIKDQISTTKKPFSCSRINGIEVYDIEKEIVNCLYWASYALSLWIFSQTGNAFFSGLLPTSLTPIVLPITDSDSVNIQLDAISENFSTLRKQKSAIRETWPMAHISSVAAYIFALYPLDLGHCSALTTSFWQDIPHLALQSVRQGNPVRDVGSACGEITRLLTESAQLLDQQVTEGSSRSLVLAVYHTMAIHFLFPSEEQTGCEHLLTADTMERFCSATEIIVQLFASFSDHTEDLFIDNPPLRSFFTDVFCMSLDTCSRALNAIFKQQDTIILNSNLNTVGAQEAEWMHIFEPKLETLATGLYSMSQHDLLNHSTTIRPVRRQLRARVRALGGSPGSDSSGSPSPDNGREFLSLPHTPLRSPALSMLGKGTIAHSPASFASPQDHSEFSSSLMSSSVRSSDAPMASHSTSLAGSNKKDWHGLDQSFQGFLESNAVHPPAGTHLGLADAVSLSTVWYPQVPTVMDLDMEAPVPLACHQFEWPDAELGVERSDGDSMMYCFDGDERKIL